MSSQCPVTESLPGEDSAMRPNAARGAGSSSTPSTNATDRKSEAAERRETQANAPGDVAERVAALVLVGCGIGKLANADAIENDEDDAGGS